MNTQAGHKESVINRMKGELNSLRDEVRALRSEVSSDEPEVSSAESNATNRSRDKNIPTQEPIPVERLLVLSGTMNGLSVKVLKDDGCNTNVVSREFLAKYRSRNIFEVCQGYVRVQHSQKETKEEASEVILNGTLRLGAHTYTSSWIVANCRYDVLLGMPWHVAHNPSIDYEKRIFKVGPHVIPALRKNCEKLQVTNLGVKSFRKMVRKNMKKVELFQVMIRETMNFTGEKCVKKKAKLEQLFAELESVFKT